MLELWFPAQSRKLWCDNEISGELENFFNKTLTYVKWIKGCTIKPWEMAVSQGFLYGWDYEEIS